MKQLQHSGLLFDINVSELLSNTPIGVKLAVIFGLLLCALIKIWWKRYNDQKFLEAASKAGVKSYRRFMGRTKVEFKDELKKEEHDETKESKLRKVD